MVHIKITSKLYVDNILYQLCVTYKESAQLFRNKFSQGFDN